MCRILGHNPSRSRIVRDIHTLQAETVCKRCGIALVQQEGGSAWVAAMEDAPARG